jgi:hypothetical protein
MQVFIKNAGMSVKCQETLPLPRHQVLVSPVLSNSKSVWCVVVQHTPDTLPTLQLRLKGVFVFSCKVVVGISYSSNSLTRNVRDMTSSGLTTFPEFRHLKSITAQGSKENVLARKIWYVRYGKK